MGLYIIIPAYNEEECIVPVVKEWCTIVDRIGGDSRLVIFNDGSTDGTFRELERLRPSLRRLYVVNKANTGHGPTCLAAYKYAIAQGAEWIFQTDADGQTSPDDFWLLWTRRNEADFILGTRLSRGDGLARWIISRVLRIVILCVFGVYIQDANVPFRLMNAKMLEPILNQIAPNFFLANALLAIYIVKSKQNVLWQKISFQNRQGGVPSVNYGRFLRVGMRVIRDFYDIQYST